MALGEGTHGTREFFRMKHRITEFLASEMGFTVFAIEASMPDARRVNDYVLRGEGDAKEALAGLYFWTWNTEEVLAMIEWMREYNASGRGRIEFWGFDVQYPTAAMDSVRSFIEETEPGYLGTLSEEIDTIEDAKEDAFANRGNRDEHYARWREAAARVLEHLEENRDRYLASTDALRVDWAIQNARVAFQGADIRLAGGRSRDEDMADNVNWILDHSPPETKIVLWAHNGHVSLDSTYRPMGVALAERYGEDMSVFGFAFHEGEYTAMGKRRARHLRHLSFGARKRRVGARGHRHTELHARPAERVGRVRPERVADGRTRLSLDRRDGRRVRVLAGGCDRYVRCACLLRREPSVPSGARQTVVASARPVRGNP